VKETHLRTLEIQPLIHTNVQRNGLTNTHIFMLLIVYWDY